MKRFLIFSLIVGTLFLPSISLAAMSVLNVGMNQVAAAATNITATLRTQTSTVVAVVCRHGTDFAPVTSATDTLGTTFFPIATASDTNDGAMTVFWGAVNATTSDSIGCNYAGSVANRWMLATNLSGVATTTPIDVTSTAANAVSGAGPWHSGTYTTTNANDTIVSFFDANAISFVTSSNPFLTHISQVGLAGGGVGSLVTSTIQSTQSSSWTGGANSTFMSIVAAFKQIATTTVVDSYRTPGNATWTAPTGVTSVTVMAWGGGGAGGAATSSASSGGGGGGGGGAFAQKNTFSVTPGTGYTVVVGQGGIAAINASGTPGTASLFNATTTLNAAPGLGAGRGANGTAGAAGAAGSVASSTGDVVFAGGAGGAGGSSGSTGCGGGGGGGAGTVFGGLAGSAGSTCGLVATEQTAGGVGGAIGGGVGGTGGSGQRGSAGSTNGGGGGGGYAGAAGFGAAGANGAIEIIYTIPTSTPATVARRRQAGVIFIQ